ncbi:binding partner of ACD11 1-like protein [Tanacetum coccineum]
MQSRTVQVTQLSDLATHNHIHEFFSFSGDIEHIQISLDSERNKTAFVTFKDAKALEIALCLSGATLVDRIVNITQVENYVLNSELMESAVDNAASMSRQSSFSRQSSMSRQSSFSNAEANGYSPRSGRVYASKAQDVVSSVLAKGSAIGQDAMNKAKAFDEKHQLRANASARVISLDKKVGLTEKFSVGISVVNKKVKSVDQRLQVSDKTMAAIMAAERKINNTGSAVKSSRYVTAGAAWLNGAFGKVAKAGQVAGAHDKVGTQAYVLQPDWSEVSEAIFENKQSQAQKKDDLNIGQNDIRSEDPFNIYDLLNKKQDNIIGGSSSDDNMKYPLGFTPTDHVAFKVKKTCPLSNPKEDREGSICSGHFKKAELPRSGGSMLQLMKDLIKDPRMFHKINSTISDYFVMIRGEWVPNGKKLSYISVYALQELTEKKMLWDYLTIVIDNWNDEVVIMGDFNEVRKQAERIWLYI